MPSSRRRSLVLRFGGLFIACLALLLATAFFAQRAALTSLSHDNADHLQAYAAYLQTQLNQLELLSAVACTNPSVIDLLLAPGPAVRERVNRGVESFSSATGAAMVYVVNAEGTVVAASDWREAWSRIGENLSTQPLWRIALSAPHRHLVAFGRTTSRLGYYSSSPVIHDGRRIGTVVVRQDIDRLVAAWPRARGQRLAVADEHGVVFLASDMQWLLHTMWPLSADARRALETTQQYGDSPLPPLPLRTVRAEGGDAAIVAIGSDTGYTGDEARYLLQMRRLEGTEWNVYALSSLNRLRQWSFIAVILVGALLAVVLLVGLSLYKRRQYLRQLVDNSIRDPLTRLFTRIYMRDAVAGLESLQDREHGIHLALVLFDLDQFKRVNDTYGHRVGDIVLRAVGRVILDEVRESDVPVRWGGEELAVFLTVRRIEEALQFAERVRDRVQGLRPVPRYKDLRVTVSAGVTVRHEGESLAAVMERADHRLYDAKHAGRNCVRFDTPPGARGSDTEHGRTLH
jgi:diguanylate cyclase (GGDEF)-like protein